jgi:hypothetical protein
MVADWGRFPWGLDSFLDSPIQNPPRLLGPGRMTSWRTVGMTESNRLLAGKPMQVSGTGISAYSRFARALTCGFGYRMFRLT